MNADLDHIAQIGAAQAAGDWNTRIERERRVQTTARRVRSISRAAALIGLFGGMGLLGINAWQRSYMVSMFGGLLLVLWIIASAVLFFMGGLAPRRVRRLLSKRERDLLDN